MLRSRGAAESSPCAVRSGAGRPKGSAHKHRAATFENRGEHLFAITTEGMARKVSAAITVTALGRSENCLRQGLDIRAGEVEFFVPAGCIFAMRSIAAGLLDQLFAWHGVELLAPGLLVDFLQSARPEAVRILPNHFASDQEWTASAAMRRAWKKDKHNDN